jgi:hypothetical protein
MIVNHFWGGWGEEERFCAQCIVHIVRTNVQILSYYVQILADRFIACRAEAGLCLLVSIAGLLHYITSQLAIADEQIKLRPP